MKFNNYLETDTMIPILALQMVQEDSDLPVLIYQNIWNGNSEKEIIPITSRYIVMLYDIKYGIVTISQWDTIFEVEEEVLNIFASKIEVFVWDIVEHIPLNYKIKPAIEWNPVSDSNQLQLV